MYAVIFEVYPTKEGKEEYLKIASTLKDFLQNREGFISIERFQSLVNENKLLNLDSKTNKDLGWSLWFRLFIYGLFLCNES